MDKTKKIKQSILLSLIKGFQSSCPKDFYLKISNRQCIMFYFLLKLFASSRYIIYINSFIPTQTN